MRVSQFSISSNYVRDRDVTLTFQFFLPSNLSAITIGQNLIVKFPPIYSDILKFTSPSCSLTLVSNSLKNYVNICYIRGIRLMIPITDTLILGSVYLLVISGLINPTTMSPYYFKY